MMEIPISLAQETIIYIVMKGSFKVRFSPPNFVVINTGWEKYRGYFRRYEKLVGRG